MNLSNTDIQKIIKYCTYQERCHSEVRNKLLQMKVYGDRLEEIISYLITEKYLNEERYARAYMRGKYRINKWGKAKIIQKLKFKSVSEYCIKKSLEEIDPDEYYSNLLDVLEKQKVPYERKTSNSYQLRKKLFDFAYQKGYEVDAINAALEDIL